jgi:hypothetical protein
MNLVPYILFGGFLDFGILIASALVPRVLNWRADLAKLAPLSQQLVWVHGAFIVLIIVGFGTLSVAMPGELASGSVLARGVCLLIAFFWACRLAVQFLVFDAKPYLQTAFLRYGYRGLSFAFAYHAIVYGLAALR